VAVLGTKPRGRRRRMEDTLDLAESGARPGDGEDGPWRCGGFKVAVVIGALSLRSIARAREVDLDSPCLNDDAIKLTLNAVALIREGRLLPILISAEML